MRLKMLLCLGAAMAGASASAEAAIIVTYAGTVVSGFDSAGVFGTPGDLTGQAFTSIYTVDDALPGAVIERSDYESSITGVNAGNPVRAVLTIKGVGVSFGALTGRGLHQNYLPHSFDNIRYEANNHANDGILFEQDTLSNQVASRVNGFLRSGQFDEPLDYLVGARDETYGFAEQLRYDYRTEVLSRPFYADLRNISVTVAPGAVPEPATWAMLVVGFGLIGAAIRRRRRPVTAFA